MKQQITAICCSKNGNILSTATNSYTKSHPLQKYFAVKVGHPHQIYLHAEIAAILKAGKKKIHTIYIKRLNGEGKWDMAKPCPICQEAIKAFGIKKVHFTNEKGNLERM